MTGDYGKFQGNQTKENIKTDQANNLFKFHATTAVNPSFNLTRIRKILKNIVKNKYKIKTC